MVFTDEQLVELYLKNKDEESLEMLVKRYLPLIYGYLRNYSGNPDVAADLTQEVFVKAWKKLGSFDRTKNFKNWVFTIAKNTAIDWLREKKSVPFSLLDDGEDSKFADNIADYGKSLFEHVSQQFTKNQLVFALEQLPESYRTIINLRNREDLSFSEVANKLKEPLNTVKSRYRRGLSLLKKFIPDDL